MEGEWRIHAKRVRQELRAALIEGEMGGPAEVFDFDMFIAEKMGAEVAPKAQSAKAQGGVLLPRCAL